MPATPDPELAATLERARDRGFLGPGPVTNHLNHSNGFLRHLIGVTGTVADLGSGGGVPGLPIAIARDDLTVVLIEATARRCQFLEESIAALRLGHRVTVVEGRAEHLGRGQLRGTLDAVVARGFGPPAVTAECASPLLRVGGVLLVSEPPEGAPRWPLACLAELGLRPLERPPSDPRFQAMLQVAHCPERYPRRVGLPAKRPLF